jgi:FkbM family methyltransferase
MKGVLRAIRWLATAPFFRRLTTVTPLVRLSFSLRASLVRERIRFIRNELRRGPVTATYRLRESGVTVALRHPGSDVMALDEIFSQREYELPQPVELALAQASESLLVVDLGANVGLFGAWILGRFPNARIVALEADPDNAAVHRVTIESNGLADRWRLVEAFAGTRAGTIHFVPGLLGLSHAADDEPGIEVPVIDVMPDLLNAELVKIDIEGAEWPILTDPRFHGLVARAVVLEYHRWGCPEDDPRATAEEALRAGGYELAHGVQKPSVGAGVLWGWRPN